MTDGKLDGRELDAAIAERVMGWRWWRTTVRFSADVRRALWEPNFKNNEWQLADGTEEKFDGDNCFIPHFSTSIAVAMEVEDRMAVLGLTSDYVAALWDVMQQPKGVNFWTQSNFTAFWM